MDRLSARLVPAAPAMLPHGAAGAGLRQQDLGLAPGSQFVPPQVMAHTPREGWGSDGLRADRCHRVQRGRTREAPGRRRPTATRRSTSQPCSRRGALGGPQRGRPDHQHPACPGARAARAEGRQDRLASVVPMGGGHTRPRGPCHPPARPRRPHPPGPPQWRGGAHERASPDP
jgi:hypothetical protein